MYLSVFYYLCYIKDISTYILEDQVLEERDPDLNGEKYIIMDAIRYDHWKDVAEEGDDKKKMHALRWEMYVKYRDNLINRDFWCPFQI